MDSCYRTLGVSPSASQADIRAAYLRLIKQHHPDVEHDQPNALSRDINYAYSILKNPQRRAEHDRALRGNRPVAVYFNAHRPAAASRQRGKALGIALLCLAGATLIFAPDFPPPALKAADVRAEVKAPSEELLTSQPPIDVRNISDAAGDATYLEGDGGTATLIMHSRFCFERLGLDGTLGLFDYCVAFDRATYAELKRKGQLTSYFQAREIDARHSHASAGFFKEPDAADARLQRLAQMVTAHSGEVARRTN